MKAVEENTFQDFLRQYDQQAWREVLKKLLPRIHSVDRDATRIWFGFWPLQLRQILNRHGDPSTLARDLELQGQYRLEEQVGSSVEFLYGSQYWSDVKRAVLSHAASCSNPRNQRLEKQIMAVATRLANEQGVREDLVTGILAVAFMILQQIGIDAFRDVEETSRISREKPSVDKILKNRSTPRKRLLNLFRTVDRRYTVVFDETKKNGAFSAIQGQDLSMAAGQDAKDYQSEDPRCTEGPIPFQCRIGSCGTCWVGILSGKEQLCAITDYERARLKYFGYDSSQSEEETHPPIRLSCQARCFGDVSIVIPPWNGILNMRRVTFDPSS